MTSQPPIERAVTTQEAADALGVSVWYLHSVKRAGGPGGRKVFITSIRKWLDEHPNFVAKKAWAKPEKGVAA